MRISSDPSFSTKWSDAWGTADQAIRRKSNGRKCQERRRHKNVIVRWLGVPLVFYIAAALDTSARYFRRYGGRGGSPFH